MLDRLTSKTGNAVTGALGTLYLTPTHLIFVDHEGKHETWVLHSHLSCIEKLSISSLGTPLQIKCKNFQAITFILPKEKDAHEVWTSLYSLSQPLSYDDLYCFRYSASNEPFKDHRSQGWDNFDLLQEFQRQGLPNSDWVLTDLNMSYALCETYPRTLIVPSTATEGVLKASAGFRSKGRLPVLTYLYSKSGAAICRCSQPLSGFNGRSEEDEQLLNCILTSSPKSVSPKFLIVVDTRPRVSGVLTSILLSSCHYYYSGSSLLKSSNLLSNKASSAITLSMIGGKRSNKSRAVSSSPASRCSSPSVSVNRPKTVCDNTSSSTEKPTNNCHSGSSSPDSSPQTSSSCTQMIVKRRRRHKKTRRRHHSVRDTNDQTYKRRHHHHHSNCPKNDLIQTDVSTPDSFRDTYVTTVNPFSTVNASTASRLSSNHFLSSMMNKLTSSCESAKNASQRSDATDICSSLSSSRSTQTQSNKPKVNAYAQKAAGKGYENESFYDNIKFNFFGIENIHVMRGSLNKLIDGEYTNYGLLIIVYHIIIVSRLPLNIFGIF